MQGHDTTRATLLRRPPALRAGGRSGHRAGNWLVGRLVGGSCPPVALTGRLGRPKTPSSDAPLPPLHDQQQGDHHHHGEGDPEPDHHSPRHAALSRATSPLARRAASGARGQLSTTNTSRPRATATATHRSASTRQPWPRNQTVITMTTAATAATSAILPGVSGVTMAIVAGRARQPASPSPGVSSSMTPKQRWCSGTPAGRDFSRSVWLCRSLKRRLASAMLAMSHRILALTSSSRALRCCCSCRCPPAGDDPAHRNVAQLPGARREVAASRCNAARHPSSSSPMPACRNSGSAPRSGARIGGARRDSREAATAPSRVPGLPRLAETSRGGGTADDRTVRSASAAVNRQGRQVAPPPITQKSRVQVRTSGALPLCQQARSTRRQGWLRMPAPVQS
jgi:hypothetical protein